ARGKELPDERKLYKYRLIRIDPSKIIYWLGYTFGRFIPKTETRTISRPFEPGRDESELETYAKMLDSPDEAAPIKSIATDHDWLARLDTTIEEGVLSEEERKILGSFRRETVSVTGSSVARSVTDAEKRLLKKSRC
ncbi:MAG TPA: hypothetical protein VFE96_07975, partial [Candidatus Bathyarchaeia archaeon]|nr:hypothetical protein [Candidatus Bathyarchaeia archaeon]